MNTTIPAPTSSTDGAQSTYWKPQGLPPPPTWWTTPHLLMLWWSIPESVWNRTCWVCTRSCVNTWGSRAMSKLRTEATEASAEGSKCCQPEGCSEETEEAWGVIQLCRSGPDSWRGQTSSPPGPALPACSPSVVSAAQQCRWGHHLRLPAVQGWAHRYELHGMGSVIGSFVMEHFLSSDWRAAISASTFGDYASNCQLYFTFP